MGARKIHLPRIPSMPTPVRYKIQKDTDHFLLIRLYYCFSTIPFDISFNKTYLYFNTTIPIQFIFKLKSKFIEKRKSPLFQACVNPRTFVQPRLLLTRKFWFLRDQRQDKLAYPRIARTCPTISTKIVSYIPSYSGRMELWVIKREENVK